MVDEPSGQLRVFVNYRRDDTAGHAGRLYDNLAVRYGEENVFMDIDRIEPGTDFGEVIDHEMASCSVMLALVGPLWLFDASGRRRIDEPDDFVRMEIEGALNRGIRVIPLLIHGGEMPSPADLPASLAPFARRHAFNIHDESWRTDIAKLLVLLDKVERERRLLEARDLEARRRMAAFVHEVQTHLRRGAGLTPELRADLDALMTYQETNPLRSMADRQVALTSLREATRRWRTLENMGGLEESRLARAVLREYATRLDELHNDPFSAG